MEKMVVISGDNLKEVNELLSQGWKVKMIHAVNGAENSAYSIYAYVVLTY